MAPPPVVISEIGKVQYKVLNELSKIEKAVIPRKCDIAEARILYLKANICLNRAIFNDHAMEGLLTKHHLDLSQTKYRKQDVLGQISRSHENIVEILGMMFNTISTSEKSVEDNLEEYEKGFSIEQALEKLEVAPVESEKPKNSEQSTSNSGASVEVHEINSANDSSSEEEDNDDFLKNITSNDQNKDFPRKSTPKKKKEIKTENHNETMYDDKLRRVLDSLDAPPFPQIQIPKFSGKKEEYHNFKAIFDSIIHNSPRNDRWKCLQLYMLCTDRAHKIIKSIDLRRENCYQEARKLLDDTFAKGETSIEDELDKLRNLKKLTKDHFQDLEDLLCESRQIKTNLKLLGFDDKATDINIIASTAAAFDRQTNKVYQKWRLNKNNSGDIDAFFKFVMNQIEVLRRDRKFVTDSIASSSSSSNNVSTSNNNNFNKLKKKEHAKVTFVTSKKGDGLICPLCTGQHYLKSCKQLLDADDKYEELKRIKYCFSCLSHPWSRDQKCTKKNAISCELCGRNHLTIMHQNKKTTLFTSLSNMEPIVLPTAIVNVYNEALGRVPVRSIIDTCSNGSYITEQLCQSLKLKRKKFDVSISGLEDMKISNVSQITEITLITDKNEIFTIKVIIVKNINNNLECFHDPKIEFKNKLSDPQFFQPKHVQLLIGANYTHLFLLPEMQRVGNYHLINSKFGWIIFGGSETTNSNENTPIDKVEKDLQSKNSVSCHFTLSEITKNLNTFFDMEIIEKEDEDENERAEKLFQTEHYRLPDGRYVAPQIWKESPQNIGNSFSRSLQMYLINEKRMEKNKKLKDMTRAAMNDSIEQ